MAPSVNQRTDLEKLEQNCLRWISDPDISNEMKEEFIRILVSRNPDLYTRKYFEGMGVNSEILDKVSAYYFINNLNNTYEKFDSIPITGGRRKSRKNYRTSRKKTMRKSRKKTMRKSRKNYRKH